MDQIITPTQMILDRKNMQTMRADVSSRAPEEACGLLAGLRDGETLRVHKVYALENVLHSSMRYRLDPQQQLKTFLEVEASGLEVVGFYHSHPKGPGRPSQSDLDEAFYPQVVYLIWFLLDERWDCRGFSIKMGQATPVKLMILNKEQHF